MTRRQGNALDAIEYWDDRYSLPDNIAHHAKQNEDIARDLSAEIHKRPLFKEAISEKLAVEVGCGTGDLCNVLTDIHYCAIEGTDLSHFAVEIAQIRFPHLLFKQHDILRDEPCGSYEIAISSNVIEHFKEPHRMIEKMFGLASKVLIVAPYNQPLSDDYDSEGGAGHVSTINLSTFAPYEIEYAFVFRTSGWQHSVAGEIPMQVAALIRQR